MEKIKMLFDWCKKNEGDLDSMHIINTSDVRDSEDSFKIYHSNGHCIIVSAEELDLAEDESCENIDGIYYNYDDELYDGFKPITIDEFIKLTENGA